jgi:tRNA(Ile)-lysidine synthase
LGLLAIARDWARARGVPLTAFHVDHGLRATSAADAARARAAAAALGADFLTLAWTGVKPTHGVQASARTARHRLLARACAVLGAKTLLLGHTLDDQAETVLMRLGRAPATSRGLGGLEALGPSPAWPEGAGLALARPLLDATRATLRERLSAAGLAWIEDPSNADPRHERVRARAALAELGPDARGRLIAVAARAQAAEEARRRAARAVVASAVRPLDFGGFALDRALFERAPRPARARALEAALTAAAGAPGPLAPEALDRLIDGLRPFEAFRGATLGGAVLAPLGESRVVAARDPGALAGRRGAAPASQASDIDDDVWDGRLRLAEGVDRQGEIVAAKGLMATMGRTDRARLHAVPPAVRRTAAALRGPDGSATLVAGEFIASQAIARRVLPRRPRAWSDEASARAALGFGAFAPHMGKHRGTMSDTGTDAGCADPIDENEVAWA